MTPMRDTFRGCFLADFSGLAPTARRRPLPALSPLDPFPFLDPGAWPFAGRVGRKDSGVNFASLSLTADAERTVKGEDVFPMNKTSRGFQRVEIQKLRHFDVQF
jgi:hypothetical protein